MVILEWDDVRMEKKCCCANLSDQWESQQAAVAAYSQQKQLTSAALA